MIQINLNSIVASVSGPKRPQDRVAITDMKSDFQACLNEKVSYLLLLLCCVLSSKGPSGFGTISYSVYIMAYANNLFFLLSVIH